MKPLERLTHRVTTCPDDGLSTFLSVRPRLFGIAYRMLGSAAEAEDIVQDVWVPGRPRIAVWFATPRRSSRRRRHDWRSTSCSQHARAEKRTSGPGGRNQSTRVPTLAWERNEARRWSWES